MSKPKPTTEKGRKRYRVVTGMNYRDQRAEPGDIVADLPEKSIEWLEKQGHILPIREELKGKEPKPKTAQTEPPLEDE